MSFKTKTKIDKHSQEQVNMLHNMFNQMTGAEGADLEILLTKCLDLFACVKNYYKVYKTLLLAPFLKDKTPLETFLVEMEKLIDGMPKVENIHKLTKEELNDYYTTFIKDNVIKQIVITCNNLHPFKASLVNKENLDDGFIRRQAGLSMTPISFFQTLDLKILFIDKNVNAASKKMLLQILYHTYNKGVEIHDLITSPNIDIKKFCSLLVNNINVLRKKIKQCDGAFDKIVASVQLLENNFKTYFQQSVRANNPSIIMENFIIDVSQKQSDMSEVDKRQFSKIIEYMRTQTEKRNDPTIKKLFSALQENFDLMK